MTDPCLTYPGKDIPATWVANRTLLARIHQHHAVIKKMGCEMRIGGDFNFSIDENENDARTRQQANNENIQEALELIRSGAHFERSFSLPESPHQTQRDTFVTRTKAEYIAWLGSFKTAASDAKAFQTLIARVEKFNTCDCIMAQLQKKFHGRLEFNFAYPAKSRQRKWPKYGERYDEFRLFNKALPGFFLPSHTTHDNSLKDYFDLGIPEFQIRPTGPVDAIRTAHEVLDYAMMLGNELGYVIAPGIQHFHVDVIEKESGKCLTQLETDGGVDKKHGLPSRSYHEILSSLTQTVDQTMPVFYPQEFQKTLGDVPYQQSVRVTLDKMPWCYESTIRAMSNRFEFRSAFDTPPHMALPVALITASVLEGLRHWEKNKNAPWQSPEPVETISTPMFADKKPAKGLTGDMLRYVFGVQSPTPGAERVLMQGTNRWVFGGGNGLTARQFEEFKGHEKLASLLGDGLAGRITHACGLKKQSVNTRRMM